jgi:trehalose 6-phosphate phosphatase
VTRRRALAAPPPLDLARTALFCDLDGTLAPIRPRPQDVGPDPRRALVLGRLALALDGALAVVSGRSLADLDRILEQGVTAVSAVHGLARRRADGSLIESAGAPVPDAVRHVLAAAVMGRPGLAIEDKGAATALHYRNAPAAEPDCRDLAERLAAEHGLKLQPGSMVFELRAPGPTKADAVAAFMAEAPFVGRVPIFVGDDLTDEDGFAGAQALAGHGVIVGWRRPTQADFALEDVEAALAWMAKAGGLPPV